MNPTPPSGPPAPNPPAPPGGYVVPPGYQAQKDAENIKLLVIFHYVYAGLLAVGTLWPLIYVVMGLMVFSMAPTSVTPSSPTVSPVVSPAMPSSTAPSGAGPTVSPATSSSPSGSGVIYGSSSSSPASAQQAKIMGGVFFGVGVAMSLGFLAMAVVNFLVGRFLSARRHRIFILVISGLNSMAFPFGTGVGVFTFIVLLRPSVEALFEGKAEPIGVQS